MKIPALLLALMVLGFAATAGTVAGAETMTLSGHVQHTDGTPFADADITIQDIDRDTTLAVIQTSAQGDFSLQGIDAGNYSVTAGHALYEANATYPQVSSTASDLNFTLYEVQGTVTGHVTDGNTTLSGVQITLSNSVNSFSTLSTAPFGLFTLENVTSGTYIAHATKDGYDSGSGIYPDPVEVSNGKIVELNFTLTALANQPANLGGKVTYNGEPLSGVKVVLSPLEGSDITITSDAQGNYQFKSVTAGQYELLLSKSGYIGTSQKVVLEPFKDKNVDVSMKKDTLPGNSGFLMDYDLSHSLMVVALGLALITTLAALFIRYRARNKPDILESEEESSE